LLVIAGHPPLGLDYTNPSVEDVPSAPECVPADDSAGRDQFPAANANGIVCCQAASAADLSFSPPPLAPVTSDATAGKWQGYLV